MLSKYTTGNKPTRDKIGTYEVRHVNGADAVLTLVVHISIELSFLI